MGKKKPTDVPPQGARPMTDSDRLQLTLAAAQAQAPGCDVSLLSAGQTPEGGWDVVTRGDGLAVRFTFAAGTADPQKAAARSAVLALDLTDATRDAARAAAKALLALAHDQTGDVLRAVVLVTIDEVNALRARLRAQDAAVAGAATLAALKAAWAALPAAPDRTGAQARAAVGAKLDAGDADS